MGLPVLALVISNIIWGMASPIFKWSLSVIPPFTLAFFRFYIATVILFFLLRGKIFDFPRRDFWKMCLVGLFGVTINITFFFWGLRLSKAMNAPVIATTQPLIIFLLAVLFLGEKKTGKKLIGTILGFIGVLVIIGKPYLTQGFSPEVLGDLFFIVAALGAVGQTVIGKRVMNGNTNLNPYVVTYWMFAVGTITFFPLFIHEAVTVQTPMLQLIFTLQGMVGIVFGSLLSSLAAYSIYMWALSKISASDAGVFTYIDPIAAIVIAIPLLREKISQEFIIGSLLVFAGIWIAERSKIEK